MRSSATFNPVMTGHAERFMRSDTGYVGRQIFPSFPAAEQSATYPVWLPENDLNVPTNLRRAPGTPFARTTPALSDQPYVTRNYGHETPVADETRAKYKRHIDADVAAVRRNVNYMRLAHEQRVITKVKSGSVPGAAVAAKWDVAGTNIRDHVIAGAEVIRKATGIARSQLRLAISRPVMNALESNTAIRDQIKYVSAESLTADMVARYLQIGGVDIAEQVVNGAAEGQALAPADIWDDTGLLYYSSGVADLETPTFGRTFEWQDFSGADGVLIESYRDETIKSDVHRSSMHCDEGLVCVACGYRLDDLLT